MSTKTAGLWSRLTESLRIKPLKPHRSSPPKAGSKPPKAEKDILTRSVQQPQEDKNSSTQDPANQDAGPEGGPGNGKSPSGLSRWTKREPSLAKLQDGYERMLGLMEDIQNHMAVQGERGDRICNSLEQLAKALNDHPNTSRRQSEMLQTIAAQIETANSRNQTLVEAVSKMPELSKTQNESLGKLNRQLEVTNEQNIANNRTLDKVGSTLSSLGEANTSQSSALREMNEKTNQQNELLTKLIAAQSRRFTMLFVVTLVLASTAVIASLISVLLSQ